MGRADFPDSAHICIIQEFLGMSIRPAQNKLVLQIASDQTLFKIDFKLGVDLPPVLPVSGPFFVISIVARSVWRFTQTLGCSLYLCDLSICSIQIQDKDIVLVFTKNNII